jgi:hypothetical protein
LLVSRAHPSGPAVRLGQVGRRGPAARVVHVRRRGRLVLGYPLAPAGLAVRPVRAVRKDQPAPARRRAPGDRPVLAGLERLGGRRDQSVRQGQPHQQARKDLAVPCKPPTRSSRWQREWPPTVASEFGTDAGPHACSRIPAPFCARLHRTGRLPGEPPAHAQSSPHRRDRG